MADTKVYTIPLRREFQKAPYKRKTNKAVRALKQYVVKHTKCDVVLVGEELNEHLWSRGITNPPAKVQVEITTEIKKEDKVETKESFVNLVGFGKKVVTQSKKGILSNENAGLQGKLKDAVANLKGKDKDKDESSDSDESKPKKEVKTPSKPKAKVEEAPKVEAKAPAKEAAPKAEAKAKDITAE